MPKRRWRTRQETTSRVQVSSPVLFLERFSCPFLLQPVRLQHSQGGVLAQVWSAQRACASRASRSASRRSNFGLYRRGLQDSPGVHASRLAADHHLLPVSDQGGQELARRLKPVGSDKTAIVTSRLEVDASLSLIYDYICGVLLRGNPTEFHPTNGRIVVHVPLCVVAHDSCVVPTVRMLAMVTNHSCDQVLRRHIW